MRLDTLQTIDQSDETTKRQKDKKAERHKLTRERPEREFNVLMPGYFCTLAMFLIQGWSLTTTPEKDKGSGWTLPEGPPLDNVHKYVDYSALRRTRNQNDNLFKFISLNCQDFKNGGKMAQISPKWHMNHSLCQQPLQKKNQSL